MIKPTTYMNGSGIAAREIADLYNIEPKDMLIVLDDFNLQFGQLRLRAKGSDGGHNGLNSVIYHLGTDEIPRLRIGIGIEENMDRVNYVLSEFKEKESMNELINRGVYALELLFNEDFEQAMRKINIRRIDD